MSNLLRKQECSAAQVCGRREARGRLRSRLTTPVQQSTFLMRGCLPRRESLMVRTKLELETRLHCLANLIESQLAGVLCELLAESRTEAVQDIASSGTRFIENCRNVRDRKEKEGGAA